MSKRRPWLCAALSLSLVASYALADEAQHALSVQAVVRMALKAARHMAPGRADALGRRARLSGLMPQMKLGVRRGLQQDLTSTSTSSDDRTNASLGDDLTLEAGLTFQLDRLVFAPEQVRLLAVERWLASDRRKLIEAVVQLFFRRARLVHERARAANHDPALDVDIAELDALLDAYTDHGFSAALAQLARRTNTPAHTTDTTAPAKLTEPETRPPASRDTQTPINAGSEATHGPR